MNPHRIEPHTPLALLASLRANGPLIAQMTWREVVGRYRGSLIGLTWSFLNPMLMLFVYTWVFSVIFKSRWAGSPAGDDRVHFALMLFVGLIVHAFVADCVNRAPGLVVSNANYVKRVVFPLEILPWTAVGSALFHALISLVVLLVAQLALRHSLPATALLFPFVMLPLVAICIGLCWLLAALGVYVRDIAQVTGVATSLLMFLSPVFYPTAALPEAARPWIALNPLATVIEASRDVLILGRLPPLGPWLAVAVAGVVVATAGFWWFQKTRKGFADVL